MQAEVRLEYDTIMAFLSLANSLRGGFSVVICFSNDNH